MPAMAKDSADHPCRACGAPVPGTAGGGAVLIIRVDNLPETTAFLSGALDEVPCPVCERKSGVAPTLVLCSAIDKVAGVALTSLAHDQPKLAQETADDLRGRGIATTIVPSPDHLRGWLVTRWHERLATLTEIITSGEPDGIPPAALDACDAEAFVGAAAIVGTGLTEGPFTVPPGAEPDAVLDFLAGLQARALAALCARWAANTGDRLERDLRRHVPEGGLLPATAEKVVPVLRALLGSEVSEALRYSAHALLASVCVESGRPDPEAAGWAETWLHHEVLLSAAPTEPEVLATLRGCRTAEARARATVDHRRLFNAAAAMVMRTGSTLTGPIVEAGRRAGYDSLGSDLLESLRFEPGTQLSPEQVLDALQPFAPGRHPAAALRAADRLLGAVPALTPDQVWQMADTMAGWWPGSREAGVTCEIWAGAILSKISAPAELLARIGESPRAFESTLGFGERAELQRVRGEALIGVGRPAEAVTLLTDFLATGDLATGDLATGVPADDLTELRGTLAVAKRHCRRTEEAATELREIAYEGDTVTQLTTRHALLGALIELGQLDEALTVALDARRLASGPHAGSAALFDAALANVLAATGRPVEAASALRAVPIDDLADPAVLIPFASALLSSPDVLNTPDGRRTAATVVEHLHHTWKKCGRSALTEPAKQALRLLALLSDRTGAGEPAVLWQALADLCESWGDAEPMAAMALAAAAARRDRPEQVRAGLDRAFAELAAAYSGERKLARNHLSTRFLRGFTRDIERAVGAAGLPAEYRRVAIDLGRDIIGRRTSLPGAAAPWDSVLTAAPGSIAVIDWEDRTDGPRPVVTVVRDGTVTTAVAEPSPVDLDLLARHLTAKLGGWHDHRRGDPFDLPMWREAADWFARFVTRHSRPDETVVLIAHPTATRTPWHVAVTPHRPTFSVPSWSAVVSEFDRPAPRLAGLGCAVAPRFAEDIEVIGAFDDVVDGLRGLGSAALTEHSSPADHAGLAGMLRRADLCVVLCHGYAPVTEPTVAWLLAAGGSLPLRGSVEAATAAGRRHQFTWDDCDHLPAASPVVVSAACSTARTHDAGSTEQLGLYSALRRRGTRTFIAPRWNIPARRTLPVFADAVRRLVDHTDPPAVAVRAASLAAAEHLPTWLAYAPTAAGGWWASTSEGAPP
ncbi:hypothetical protein DMB66_32235 [Actinoplanes sp. ATCC 53533]|uniref:CHAT domain-containing protein n=1 Tax=Actinoplanes sp. ATCC 53533 TaxID=1288362 RepID=UPI000F7756EF|nr:CHAT domain-containing protein [Actinoplanes sp. ATCC 53533]RSM57710.1 hypothetical protein DMB66_32235 [Actinoplanes sp. ATCC 53533]